MTLGAVVAIGAFLAVAGACSTASNPDVQGSTVGSDIDSSLQGGCSIGKEGCACDTPGQTVSCGHLVSDYGSYVTCQEGMATCENGSWGACVGNTVFQKSKRGTTLDRASTDGFRPLAQPVTCTDPCDPNTCTQTTDGSGDVPDGAPVLITDAGVSLIPTTTTGGGGNGDAGTCTGLQCQIDWGCGSSSYTTITGTVYDPAMQNPLYNAYVYVPVDPNPANLPAFSTGASCNSCSGVSLNAVAVTQTDVHGKFTLTNVPTTAKAPNAQIPLVVQMGKWRRVQMLSTVPDCQTTAIPNANSRLPQSKFDGYNNQADIPHMALASGSADPFECMMLRMGISPAEFELPGGSRRIDFYQANGLQFQGGGAPGYSQLTGSLATLESYDVVLLPCEGTEDDGNENYSDNVAAYTLAGGRMFTTHYGYTWLATPNNGANGGSATNPVTGQPNIFYKAATWNYDDSANSATGQIDTNFPKGATFETWMDGLPAPNAGAVTTGAFTINSPRHDLTSVNPAYATEWMHDTSWESPKPLSFTLNTPLGAGIGDAGADGGPAVCGRVVYSDFHVSTSDIIGGNGSCSSNADCGYGATCSTATLGTCGAQSCYAATDCGDSHFTCPGGVANTCSRTTCTKNSNCSSNVCTAGHCGCASNADCTENSPANGVCTAGACVYTGGCTRSQDCRGHGESSDAACGGGTLATCVPNACTTNAQCTGTEQCTGGTCQGCYQSGDCPGSSQTCSGSPGGMCSGNASQFPEACAQGPLTPQESALEFMLLDLTACVSPDNAAPPGPPTPVVSYSPATFTINFASSCPSGTHVRWTELDWKATVPSTASIVFQGQTATPPTDGGPPNYGSAQKVQVANATTTTPGLPAGWNAALIDVSPVDAGAGGAFNTASPAVQSQTDFLLTITLNPTADKTQAPTLIQWQVKSDCPPSE